MKPYTHRPPTCRTEESGATLIEVLVAIVVLSIGLLGLAGLQMTGLQSNHSAYLRSQATLLAYDLSDRMRVQRQAALSGAFDDASPSAERIGWNNEVASMLGAGATGSVVRSGADVTITITWNDDRGRIRGQGEVATVTNVNFVYRTEL